MGASSTFYPARVHANLSKLSDGPLTERRAISLSDKDMEVAEMFARELSALQGSLIYCWS